MLRKAVDRSSFQKVSKYSFAEKSRIAFKMSLKKGRNDVVSFEKSFLILKHILNFYDRLWP